MGLGSKLTSGVALGLGNLSRAAVRLDWSTDSDLDLVSGFFDFNGRPIPQSAVYFDRLQNFGGAVMLDKDKQTGLSRGLAKQNGSDETTVYDLSRLPQNVASLHVAAIAQDQPHLGRYGVTFKTAGQSQAVILDAQTNQSLGFIDLDDQYGPYSAAGLGTFTRAHVGGPFQFVPQFRAYSSIAELAVAIGEPV